MSIVINVSVCKGPPFEEDCVDWQQAKQEGERLQTRSIALRQRLQRPPETKPAKDRPP